jgi:thymidylate synthase (FAD)
MEIITTRDIGRQILRHRSFSFQEFSQRYAEIDSLGEFSLKEARLQDAKNRQNSIVTDNLALQAWWETRQKRVIDECKAAYDWALANGIAKEQARGVLPEGLTPSKMYMNGSIRSWIFYLKQRLDPSTQKEHRELAEKVLEQLTIVAPVTFKAFFD